MVLGDTMAGLLFSTRLGVFFAPYSDDSNRDESNKRVVDRSLSVSRVSPFQELDDFQVDWNRVILFRTI